MDTFINLTEENIADEHLCCIIRNKKPHAGVEAKREWLSKRLKEDHVFRKLQKQAVVFIEYAPLEKAWVPIIGENFYYIYCLWVSGSEKGHGYGKSLLQYCIEDAKANGKSGICMLGSKKQKHWLSDQNFAKSFGFEIVDRTDSDYELLALSFDGTTPSFTQQAKASKIDEKDLTMYYDMQCPYVYQTIEKIKAYCEQENIPLRLQCIDTLEKAKQLPCAFNNFAVFYNGIFETVNLLDISSLEKITKRKDLTL
ncbi:MAG: GNAT family N-acetyltransferase [Longicatena sp.]